MFNIYVFDGKSKIPDETCYIIAKDGIYLNKKLDLISSLTPVDKISFLEELKSFASIDIPKIPINVFGSIIGFFKKVYELYKSEAIILLYYNKEKKSFKVQVPEQTVSPASLSYTPIQSVKDYILIGSIHSHGSMAAFHSGTDVGDEESFDGIHLTIGKISDELFDCCASIAVNGYRVKVDPTEYIESLELVNNVPSFETKNGIIYTNSIRISSGYDLKSKSKKVFKFEKDWLEKVKERVFASYVYPGTVKYKWEGGKLVKIEDDKPSILRNTNNKFDFVSLNDLVEQNDNTNSLCRTCLHRRDKITTEDIKGIDDKDCEDNFDWWYF